MKQLTRESIRCVLEMDDEVNDKMIDYGLAVLAGEIASPLATPLPRVLKHSDVTRLLQVNKSTLHVYVRAGLLERVYGANQRAIGISLDSYKRMIEIENGRRSYETTNI